MPGIVGVASSVNREDLDTCIENMVQPMMYRRWYRVQKRVMTGAGLASISLDDKKFVSEQNRVLLVVTGEIFDQEKLRAKLWGNGDRDTSCDISDLLLKLYFRFGVESLCGLNGLYIICIWESDHKKLTIINDRYGFKKLYYWFSKDRLMFASEYKSIVWHPQFNKKISELAVANFLSVSYLLDDRTFFEDIKLVPPASVMIYKEGQLTFRRYWDYEFSNRVEGKVRSEEYYIDEYALRVKEAVRKRCRENMCLPITGGLDSRTLAAMASQSLEFSKVITCTIGHKHCYDVRFSRKIARSLGYKHTFIPVGPGYIEEYMDEGIWRLEGGAYCFTFWIFALDAFLEKNNTKFAMSGFLGGCLSGGQGYFSPALSEETNPEKAIELLYRTFFNNVFEDRELAIILKPGVYKHISGESFASIKRCFNAPGTDNILNKSNYVDLHQRQRRFIAYHMDILGTFSEVLDPFADNEFVDFILSVPIEMKLGQRIYKKMIVKHLDKVSKIPRAINGLPLNASKLRQSSFNLWNRFYGRILPRLTAGKLGHEYRHVTHDEWLMTESKNFVISTLRQKEYLEDYFNMDAVNNLVADHMAGKKNAYTKICALMTFLLWRKRFCQ